MNELMRNEILDQPDALRQCLPNLRSQLAEILPPNEAFQRICFTGSGDSYFAPLALRFAAQKHLAGSVEVLSAFDSARYRQFSSTDLVIALSISGESLFTIAAAEAAEEAGASVIAATTNETSSLTQMSHRSLILPFQSRSRKTPHTTDYLITLLGIAMIIEALGEHSFPMLDSLSANVSQTLDALEEPCQEIGETLIEKDHFYFLGAGPHFATAQYGAAKFWEASGLRAHPFELEEFTHGPHLMLAPSDPVFVISPNGRSQSRAVEVMDGLRRIGANVFAVTDTIETSSEIQVIRIPRLDEEWSPFLTCLPLQWLCWTVASGKGYDVARKDGLRTNPQLYEVLR